MGDSAMSSVKLEGNSGGSGSVTLKSPSLNSDITVTLPDENLTLSGGASTSLGDVGTYAYLGNTNGNTNIDEGVSYAGSGLRYAGLNIDRWLTANVVGTDRGGTPSGTWRAMGHCNAHSSSNRRTTTLFVRIS
jgi:hypothetical protein